MSLQTRIKAAGAAAAAAPVDAGRRRAVKRRTKRAVMDRMGYDEVARISAYVDPVLARSELRPAVEAALNVEDPTDLATPERETIIDEILDDVVGLGPLQPLIEDDTVTEIMINGCRSAFFERGGVLHPIEHAFEDDEQIRVLIDRIISPLGRRIDERSDSHHPKVLGPYLLAGRAWGAGVAAALVCAAAVVRGVAATGPGGCGRHGIW